MFYIHSTNIVLQPSSFYQFTLLLNGLFLSLTVFISTSYPQSYDDMHHVCMYFSNCFISPPLDMTAIDLYNFRFPYIYLHPVFPAYWQTKVRKSKTIVSNCNTMKTCYVYGNLNSISEM